MKIRADVKGLVFEAGYFSRGFSIQH